MYCILIREGFREEKTLKKSGLLERYIYMGIFHPMWCQIYYLANWSSLQLCVFHNAAGIVSSNTFFIFYIKSSIVIYCVYIKVI